MELNNTNVQVRMDIDNLECEDIFLYHQDSNKFLCKAKLQKPVHMARVNQTAADKKTIYEFGQHKSNIKKYIQSETKKFDEEVEKSGLNVKLLSPISYKKDEIKQAEDYLITGSIEQNNTAKKKTVRPKILKIPLSVPNRRNTPNLTKRIFNKSR